MQPTKVVPAIDTIVSSKDYAETIINYENKVKMYKNRLKKATNPTNIKEYTQELKEAEDKLANTYRESFIYYSHEIINNDIDKIKRNKSVFIAWIIIFSVIIIVVIITMTIVFTKPDDPPAKYNDNVIIGCVDIDIDLCAYGPSKNNPSKCKLLLCSDDKVNTTYGECVSLAYKCSFKNNSCFNGINGTGNDCNQNCNNSNANPAWIYGQNHDPGAYVNAWKNTSGGQCITKCQTPTYDGTDNGFCVVKNCVTSICNENAGVCGHPCKLPKSTVNLGNTDSGKCDYAKCPIRAGNINNLKCGNICKTYYNANHTGKAFMAHTVHGACTKACPSENTKCTQYGNFLCAPNCDFLISKTKSTQCDDIAKTCKLVCYVDCPYGTNIIYFKDANGNNQGIKSKICNKTCNYKTQVNTANGECIPIKNNCLNIHGTSVGAYFKDKKNHGCVTKTWCYVPINNQFMCKPNPKYTNNAIVDGVALNSDINKRSTCALPQPNGHDPISCGDNNAITRVTDNCSPYFYTAHASIVGIGKNCTIPASQCDHPGVSFSNGYGVCKNDCAKNADGTPKLNYAKTACCDDIPNCNGKSIILNDKVIICDDYPNLCTVNTVNCTTCKLKADCFNNGVSRKGNYCRTDKGKYNSCTGKLNVPGIKGIHGATCYTYHGEAKKCRLGVNFNFNGCMQSCGFTTVSYRPATCQQWSQDGHCMETRNDNHAPNCLNTKSEKLIGRMCYIANQYTAPTAGFNCRYCETGNKNEHQCNLDLIWQPFIGNRNNHCYTNKDNKKASDAEYGLGYNCKGRGTVQRKNPCANCNYGWQTKQHNQYYYNKNSCPATYTKSNVYPVQTWLLHNY